MKKSVVLAYPRFVKGWQAQPRLAIPMNLLCIATLLSREGYRVRIIDQRIERQWRSILKKELEQDPICVGISGKTGPQLRYALEVSRMAKEYGNAPVVWAGVHASLLPEQTLQNENCDIVVQGEEEETFLEMVRALEGKTSLGSVKGIWFAENGHARHTGVRPFLDLNEQPPLSYHLIDPGRYYRTMFGVEHLNFSTSRGCPHRCTFCFENAFCRRTWRAMAPDLAVQRIKHFVREYKVRGLTLSDVNFFTDMDRGRSILEGLIREDLGIVISKINVRVDTLSKMNQADFGLLGRVGCRRLTIGVESGSERIQSLLKKPIDVPRLLEINCKIKRFSIVPVYFFMMGFPTETEDDLAASVSLAFRLLDENPDAVRTFNIFTPFPGTELFDLAVEHGLPVPRRTEDWIPFSYRNVSQNVPWLSREMCRIVEMLDFCSCFVGKRHFLQPYEKTNPLVTLLSNMYAPLARKRVERLWSRFPLEVKLAKLLRVYAKHD